MATTNTHSLTHRGLKLSLEVLVLPTAPHFRYTASAALATMRDQVKAQGK